MVWTMVSREERSRPSSWARVGSSQTLGSASSSSTSASRSLRLAKSKIPPKHVGARLDIFQFLYQGVDLKHFTGPVNEKRPRILP